MECGGVSWLQSGLVDLHHRGARQHHFRIHLEKHSEFILLFISVVSSWPKKCEEDIWPRNIFSLTCCALWICSTSFFLLNSCCLCSRTRSLWPCPSCRGRSCTCPLSVRPCCAASPSVSRESCSLSCWPRRTSAPSTAARRPAACRHGPPALAQVRLMSSPKNPQNQDCNPTLTDPALPAASPPVDCTQEKSMFCRISADRTQGGEMRYHPFRLTPYQLTLRDSDAAEPQPCCLLIAEKVHSGYEGV